jgi:exodeoxyribonuclease VII small subunit
VATKKTPQKPDGSDPDLTYEQMVEKIEEITARIESGEVGLEHSIALYEQGVRLGKRCQEILRNAQQKVDELNQQLTKVGGAGSAAGALGTDGDSADSQDDE